MKYNSSIRDIISYENDLYLLLDNNNKVLLVSFKYEFKIIETKKFINDNINLNKLFMDNKKVYLVDK